MNTIIAGTDFSASSTNACMYAAQLAERLKCKLVLFNMFDSPVIHTNYGLVGVSYVLQEKLSKEKTKKLTAEIHAKFPNLQIAEFLTNRNFKTELEDFVKTHHVEAAVMGLETKTKLSKYIYGTHGVKIAGKIDCPVIIVPQNYKKHEFSDVLLVVDNMEKLKQSSLKKFEKFIKKSQSNLNLLHVKTEFELFGPVIDSLKINGVKLPIQIAKAKDLTHGVKNYCAKKHPNLIAIISKKHSAFYNFFLESNTKSLVFASKVPVISIHE